MIFTLILLLFVIAFMTIGSKKGFVRELMGLIGILAALVISTGKLDFIAEEVGGALDASPLTVSIIAFILALGLIYALFKLAAKLIYKLIDVQSLGQKDKYGGAIIGAIRGWFIFGAVLFLTILLPLPRGYYALLDDSILAKSSARSLQILYDGTSKLHPEWPSFLAKMESSLSTSAEEERKKPDKRQKSTEARIRDQVKLRFAMDKLNFYFGDGESY